MVIQREAFMARRITVHIVSVSLVSLVMGFAAASAAELGNAGKPIRLALNEWTGQQITTTIAGQILERMGYTVTYVTAGTQPQFTALKDGDIDVSLEIWPFVEYKELFEGLADGSLVKLGNLGLDPLETWYYPAYMEGQCPGLPDWTALEDCARIFANEESAPAGRLLDYPADWTSRNEERVAALGLDLTVVPAGSEGAEIAEIKTAFERQAPLLIQFWRPHWIHAGYDLRPVNLPVYEPECFEDAAWGLNPEAIYDCGWPRADVIKIASAGFAETWPAAFAFLSDFVLTNEDQEPLMKAIDLESEELSAVVGAWLGAHESAWRPAMDAALASN